MDFRFIEDFLAPNYLEYNMGLQLQKTAHEAVVSRNSENIVYLLEHEQVFTAGKLTDPEELPYDGTPVIKTDRGGKITWHGPGQLVGYPIVKLPKPLDVPKFVREIEDLLIEVVKTYGLYPIKIDGRSGVWIPEDNRGPARKIAAVGIRISQGVTMHGFALNCNNDLRPFGKIIPCGISDASVTSLSEELKLDISPKDVLKTVKENIKIHISTSVNNINL